MRAINYFGGKGHLLSRLLPHLNPPGIESFVDVFGGSASVILNREPSKCNTYNDKFEDVVHFFRVLRESGEELIRALELTPYSRQEYLESWPIQHPNDIERARMFFIRCMQSYGAHGHFHKHSAWSLSKTEYTQGVSQSLYRWISRVNGLAEVVVALKKIQIECLDFREIIAKYGQHGALLYLDPPYVLSTRTGSTRYALEMSDEDHIQMGGGTDRIRMPLGNIDLRLRFSEGYLSWPPFSKSGRGKSKQWQIQARNAHYQLFHSENATPTL